MDKQWGCAGKILGAPGNRLSKRSKGNPAVRDESNCLGKDGGAERVRWGTRSRELDP